MSAFILMGVSGSGKSTVGNLVAQALGLPFVEGDAYHSPANIAKMAGGTALNDADRVAWIVALMQAVNACPGDDVIVACSALTLGVRAGIRAQSIRPVVFLHLTADAGTIEARLHARGLHFMKAEMLPSQLRTLQTGDDAIPILTTRSLAEVCAAVQAEVMRHRSA
jgi:gluconokinase